MELKGTRHIGLIIRHGEKADKVPGLEYLIKNKVDPPITPLGIR
jgi:hypothetical protein